MAFPMAPSMPNRGFRNEAAGLFATKTPAFTTQEANPRKLRDIRLSHIAHRGLTEQILPSTSLPDDRCLGTLRAD
jgi:hypothetical protein